MKKKNILQSFIIKPPLEIDYENDSIEEIVEKIEYAIEQHPSFLKVIPAEVLNAAEELNKLREFWNRNFFAYKPIFSIILLTQINHIFY